jgi:1,4-alpha-glucan branching enzyme
VRGAIHAADDHLIAAVATGQSGDPFAVLGRHAVTVNRRPAVILRTMQPAASAVELITPGLVTPMPRRHPDGLFEARIPLTGAASDLAYSFRVHEHGTSREIVDPYQFGQILSDYDLHLFSEGTHHRAWAKLGAVYRRAL